VIAGSGPLEGQLQAQITSTGAPVRLLGRRDDVGDLLEAADVVVLSSAWEARALVAQEALRVGRPLVATAVGGIPDLVGDAALLIPPGDAGALAAALASLLDDTAARNRLAEAGRRRVAELPDEADTLAAIVDVYADVLRRGA
jgi:glycosyltransferase involved in cell wall biosynthesis